MEEKLISVVMPAYNTGKYIKYAIESILNQTYKNFEFIIINDCSTDNTEEVILSYNDHRIRYFKNEKNLGNNASRNKGNELAKGEYIAIMDSDDVAVPHRFELQFNYLEKHKYIDVVGGFIKFFDKQGAFLWSYPGNPDYHQSYLFFKNAVGQPSLMYRRDVFIKNKLIYKPECENMGDYELWFRASICGVKFKILPELLLYYRQTDTQISYRNLEDRNRKLIPFFKERLNVLGIDLPEDEFILLHNFIKGRIIINEQDYLIIEKLLSKIETQNKKQKIYNLKAFRAALFYFRLRLIKYYYFEYLSNRPKFLIKLLKLTFKTGFPSLLMFWQNDGKYLGKTGRKTYKPFSAEDQFLTNTW